MTPTPTALRDTPTAVDDAIAIALCRIAPSWPLDRLAAVNPYWGFRDLPVPEASGALAALCGSSLLMPRAYYRAQLRDGGFTTDDLARVVGAKAAARVAAELAEDRAPRARRPLVSDLADADRDPEEPSFVDSVVDHLSRTCAAYFDQGQRRVPSVDESLFGAFRRRGAVDLGPAITLGLRGFAASVARLPADPVATIAECLARADVGDEAPAYLTALLLDVGGWASYCAYLRHVAQLDGGDDPHLLELLAARAAWELAIRDGAPRADTRWRRESRRWADMARDAVAAESADWAAHRAMELAYQRGLVDGLARPPAPDATEPSARAVFCIDVRSEPLRRALEQAAPDVRTHGFAGFFGLPAEHLPLAGHVAQPQLPGPLAPRVRVVDTAPPDAAQRRAARLDLGAAWSTFKSTASSSFSFVEGLGLFYAGKLLTDGLGWTRPTTAPDAAGLSARERAALKPRLEQLRGGGPVPHETRVDLAEGILRGMGLIGAHCRLVALVGHTSRTTNNPHAAGLDCGACCGHSGEVNARAVAALLNEPAVREGLAARGLSVPTTTHFVPGLHDTMTDEVTLLDLDEVPASHDDDARRLTDALGRASAAARDRRAASLGLSERGDALRATLERRTREWSEVRPEWGLANNAAFVVAPRSRTEALDLGGRVFLHDYRWRDDEGFATLELIMTAPMIVTHWINLQYLASTVDNRRFGAGDKVLHNVVAGGLGVLEGNGGDLRVGLPLQSVHDGELPVHTPLRLAVAIAAPPGPILDVIARHATVRELVDHGWLDLLRLDDDGHVERYRAGTFVREQPSAPTSAEGE